MALVTHPETMRLVQLGQACRQGTIYNSVSRACESCVTGRTANAQGTACVCAENRFTLESSEGPNLGDRQPCKAPVDLCLDEMQYFERKEGTTTGSCGRAEGFMRSGDAMSYGCPPGTKLVGGKCESTDDSQGDMPKSSDDGGGGGELA